MAARVWLITGANSGLGLALSHLVLSKGDKVIAAARNAAKIPALLTEAGANAFTLNPSAPEAEVQQAAKEALKVYGRIDVLVNNAGYGLSGVVEELRTEGIREQFQLHVFGPVALMQALLPSFRAQRSGHILNISSIAGLAGMPSFGAYNGSKVALEAISEAVAAEVAPFGVRVHVVVPGYFPTSFIAAAKASRSGVEDPARATGAYTTREQGHGLVDLYHPVHVEQRQIGDVQKAALRMYELVNGSGLSQGLAERREWVRVPLGPDAGNRLRSKLAAISANVDAYEPVWSSTDLDDSQLKERYGI
ncbi:NAD-P-binding protein [Gloeopeniophorella convolvens]|nr:NAD-P-binding protein [Gloeopeniophorella convolvens]